MVNNDNIEGELAKLSLIDKLKYVWMKSNSSENEEASTPNTTNITMVSKLFIYIYNTNNVILCNM